VNLRPWRRARDLEAVNARLSTTIDALNRALDHSADRYDRIREMNAQLREALELYRNT
tara:strand:- start:1958 stop:2131 length:174 start_codon:yes stop_codon:yes gene_type:complete